MATYYNALVLVCIKWSIKHNDNVNETLIVGLILIESLLICPVDFL